MQYFFSLVFGYLVGSFPTAYLLVKWKTRIDIRQAGSGNVGAMNTFDVSGSKMLSTVVLVVDLLKGVLAVGLSSVFIGKEFWVMGTSGLASIAGHNYSPWLSFKGGRGLATALGVMLSLGWIFVVVWCTLWVVVYLVSKNIHLSNVTTSIISPIVLAVSPERLLQLTLPPYTSSRNFEYLAVVLCLLIVLKHFDYLSEFKKSFNKTLS